jgi:hypothetical protein
MEIDSREILKDLLEELESIKFPQQHRANIKGASDRIPRGFVLGTVNLINPTAIQRRDATQMESLKSSSKKYAKVYALAQQLIQMHDPDFEYTSIQFNKNNKCAKHRDARNVGESYIVAFGDYEGGELVIYGDDDAVCDVVNLKNTFHYFDGSRHAHETAPFEGTRYSLVYYKI